MDKHHLSRLARWMLPNLSTIIIVASMLFAYQVWAAPAAAINSSLLPTVISYQGRVTKASGEPLNGQVDMTFRLYAASSGGSALWTEAYTGDNSVTVSYGLFNVLLGSLTPINASVWTSGGPFLSVQIGSDPEMTPREQVGRVPYAMVSDRAYGLSASDGFPSNAVTVDADGAVTIRPERVTRSLRLASDESEGPGLSLENTRTGGGKYSTFVTSSGSWMFSNDTVSPSQQVFSISPQGVITFQRDVKFLGGISTLNVVGPFNANHAPGDGANTWVTTQMVDTTNSMCFLSQTYAHTDWSACKVNKSGGYWRVNAWSGVDSGEVICEALCLEW